MHKGNKSKWLIPSMIIVLLLPLLTACGGEGDDTPMIKIGIGYPLKTSPGQVNLHMAEMAVDEINEAGGVNVGGVMYDIELVSADTNEPSGADAAAAAERLTTVDGIDFFIGGTTWEAVFSIREVLADQQVVGVIHASNTDFTKSIYDNYDRYKYVFTPMVKPGHNLFSLISQAIMIGNKLEEQCGIDTPKVALLFQKGPTYDPIATSLKIMLPKFGFEVVGEWRPDQDAVDVTAELTAIQASGAQIIMQAIFGSASIVIARQWGELQIPAVLAGLNSYGDLKYWDATGGYCNYQVQVGSAQGGVAVTPKTIPFLEKFAEKYGETPSAGQNPYDIVYILADAVERAGTLEDDAIIAAMETTDYIGYMGRYVFQGLEGGWEDTHRPKEGPEYIFFNTVQWRDGELVAVWPDGNPVPGYDGWEGVRFEGTQDFVLPPWVITYWNK